MGKIDYIRGGGDQVFQQPFNALGVEFYGFLLPADVEAIQTNFCDRFLNAPSGGAVDFAPFGPWFLLVFNNLSALASADAPDREKGWFSERESATWILLEERKSGALDWFLPYIFVDNSYALCMGRETYGFRKSLGSFDVPYFPELSSYFALDTIVLQQYAGNSKGAWRNLWNVAQQAMPSVGSVSISTEIEELLKGMVQVIRTLDFHSEDELQKLWSFGKTLVEGEVPMVFLKQFPSVTDPTQACYQAIVEVPIKMTRFHGGSLLQGDYMADIQNYASHPVREDLGIEANPSNSLLSFFAKFDFFIGNGKVLWEARP